MNEAKNHIAMENYKIYKRPYIFYNFRLKQLTKKKNLKKLLGTVKGLKSEK